MAFAYEFDKITIGLTYDSITFYPKPTGIDDDSDDELFDQTERDLDDYIYTIKNKNHQLHTIDSQESDHGLCFHKPTHGQLHYHIKYPHEIDATKLVFLLNEALHFNLIKDTEITAFLAAFNKKYKSDVAQILQTIIKNKTRKDAIKSLHQLIQGCDDNRFIIALHDELLRNPSYQFLIKNKLIQGWKGQIDAKGTIGPVSKGWANLEKSSALQIAMNIHDQCERFTQRITREQVSEYSQHAFFKIKRHDKSMDIDIKPENNKIVKLLQKADGPGLERDYKKHFNKFIK